MNTSEDIGNTAMHPHSEYLQSITFMEAVYVPWMCLRKEQVVVSLACHFPMCPQICSVRVMVRSLDARRLHFGIQTHGPFPFETSEDWLPSLKYLRLFQVWCSEEKSGLEEKGKKHVRRRVSTSPWNPEEGRLDLLGKKLILRCLFVGCHGP